MIEALGDRLKVFSDILTLGRYFFTETLTHDPDAVKKRLRKEGVPKLLERARRGSGLDRALDVATLEKAVHDYAESSGHPMGQVVNPLRVATTGQGVGPGLYDCLAILGRESCRARIATTLAMLQSGHRRRPDRRQGRRQEKARSILTREAIPIPDPEHPCRWPRLAFVRAMVIAYPLFAVIA